MDYKNTLNLPRTNFAMKANLVEREPRLQARWAEEKLYERIRESRKGRPVFVMHDGPPYANGGVHIGTGMNKILKDIVVKYHTLQGKDVPYIPGWDCHGLPIEHKVMLEIRAKKEVCDHSEIRRRCREYAMKYLGLQREQFQTLGVLGDWYKPYTTFSPQYEEGVIEVFRLMFEKGYIVRALKPIHWCMSCETALAEAELEYGDEPGPSIHVLFPNAQGLAEAFEVELDAPGFVFIWTTTPWTLPANVAVAVNPVEKYALVRFSTEKLGKGYTFLGESLIEQVKAATKFESFEVVAVTSGASLEGVRYDHPFMGREGRVITADFVTMTDGTGIVHIAPGHGVEDYQAGLTNGLPVLSPVDAQGRFTADVPLWQGANVHEADPRIKAFLDDKGLLMGSVTIAHSYPHCWRCKSPVIFRATPQWFVRVDHEDLRERMLKAIEETRWVPGWGHDRIAGMVRTRPDWCISRQRVWGVPIPAFHCEDCGETLATPEILAAVQKYISVHGTDGYIVCKPEDVLPEGTHCTCGSSNLRKETDIFDVWFESGSSFRAVCMARPELSFPSDVYLEGTDQHRGWFQLSLLPSMAAYGEKPFRTVVTHGFIVDEWGQKLSKSKKKESKYDVTAAADCVKVFGADVVRLWIASVDYKEDVLFSEEVVRRLNASYFAIRNCFRFMLGNLDGFRVENALPLEHMPPVDRWALAMLAKTETACRRHYEDFEFHRLFQEFKNFCDVTLSSDYFDILKDRLYCDPVDSLSRRSATTVLYTLARSMAVMISPVLVHTCEEIWDELRTMGETLDSVHLAEWPVFDESVYDSTLPQVFGRLMAVRYAARRRLELLRAENTVRRTEEARVELYTSDLELGMLIAGMQDTLADLFKVSEVELLDAPASGMTEDEDIKGLLVKALKVEHGKCARCWCHRPEVGSIEQHPELCSRCAEAVK